MSIVKACLVITVVLSSSLAGLSAGQESQSMKEAARARGGTYTNIIHLELPGLTMPELVSASELIVRGRISGEIPRLSDDESIVITDYLISPIRFLKRPADLEFSQETSASPPLILQAVGGTLTVDGLRLETQRDGPLAVGEEYVFFLKKPVPSLATTRHFRQGVFELAAGTNALFPVHDGKVQARRLATDDAEVFLRSIQDLVELIAR